MANPKPNISIKWEKNVVVRTVLVTENQRVVCDLSRSFFLDIPETFLSCFLYCVVSWVNPSLVESFLLIFLPIFLLKPVLRDCRILYFILGRDDRILCSNKKNSHCLCSGNFVQFHPHFIYFISFSPRDLLPSTVAPTDPRQFCVPSQFGSSVLPNANMPNMLSNRVYSGMSNRQLSSVEPLWTGWLCGVCRQIHCYILEADCIAAMPVISAVAT